MRNTKTIFAGLFAIAIMALFLVSAGSAVEYRYGVVHITSVPSEAKVYTSDGSWYFDSITGEWTKWFYIGKTPMDASALIFKSRAFIIAMDGYCDKNYRVKLTPKRHNIRINAVLQPGCLGSHLSQIK